MVDIVLKDRPLPLGLRNNNPGNLRPYDGELYAGTKNIIDNFLVFDTPDNGLRGLARDIKTKVNKNNLTTVGSVTQVYAPSSENDPDNYTNLVVDNLNSLGYKITKDSNIEQLIKKDNFLKDYMKSKMKVENGADFENYFSDETILKAIKDSKVSKKGPTKKELELKINSTR
jgi:hypothetical protein